MNYLKQPLNIIEDWYGLCFDNRNCKPPKNHKKANLITCEGGRALSKTKSFSNTNASNDDSEPVLELFALLEEIKVKTTFYSFTLPANAIREPLGRLRLQLSHPGWSGRVLVKAGTKTISPGFFSRHYPIVGYSIACGKKEVKKYYNGNLSKIISSHCL